MRTTKRIRYLLPSLLFLLLTALGNAQWVAAWTGQNQGTRYDVPAGLDHVVQVAGTSSGSYALKSDGSVVSWGAGQNDVVPPGLSNVVAISGGGSHTLALKSDGTVVAWGYNGQGQCNTPAGLTGVVSIAALESGSLAVKSDGSIVSWGTPIVGTPTEAVFTAVSGSQDTGPDYAIALKSDGTVVGFGNNTGGKASPPTHLKNVKAICSAPDHSLALRYDGTVVSWGQDPLSSYSLAVPAGLKNVVEVSCCKHFSIARKSDGTLVGWGDPALMCYPGKAVGLGAGDDHMLAIVDKFTVLPDVLEVIGGSTTPCFGAVRVSSPQASDTVVQLSSNDALVTVPSSIVIPAGATEVSFVMEHERTATRRSVRITATAGSETNSSCFNVNPIHINYTGHSSIFADSIEGTVGISAAPKDPLVITLLSSDTTQGNVPATVTILPGHLTAKFPITIVDRITLKNFNVNLTLQNTTVPLQVNNQQRGWQRVVWLAFSSNPVDGGNTCTCTATLLWPAPNPVTVSLSSSDAGIASVPATVSFATGEIKATFPITTHDVTAKAVATISAILPGTQARTATLSVRPQPSIRSLAIPQLYGNQEATGVVTLSRAAAEGGTTVTLATDVPGLSVPSTVVVPVGQTNVNFTVQSDDVAVGTTVKVTASNATNYVNRSVTVKPNTPASITLSQSSLTSGQTCTATVTLAGIVRTDTSVTVLLSSTALSGPATVTVPAGSNTVSFTVTAGTLVRSSTAYVRAKRFAKTVSAPIALSP